MCVCVCHGVCVGVYRDDVETVKEYVGGICVCVCLGVCRCVCVCKCI